MKVNVEIFTLFDVKMIQIWTFPADPSTERVPSLAERVAYLRHPINLRLFNWRVPALVPSLSILSTERRGTAMYYQVTQI